MRGTPCYGAWGRVGQDGGQHAARSRCDLVGPRVAILLVALPQSAGRAQPSDLVAAYAFDEGTGTTVADLSGNGNAGVGTATWTTAGKFGSALSFNGSSCAGDGSRRGGARLTTAMTLEAWVNPTAVANGWRA